MNTNETVFSEIKCLNKLSKALHNLWVSNILTDIIFYVGNSTFRCHKVIVLAFCPAHKKKILNSRLNEIIEIKLPNSTEQGITQILSYVYTSEIHIHLFNFADIMITSYELGIDDLFQKSEAFSKKYIDERITSQKCNPDDLGLIIRSLNLLKPISDNKNYKKLMNYVASSFDCLMVTEEFLDLEAQTLKDFLCCYKICVTNEEDLLDGLLRWIRRDYYNRKIYEKDLLIHVNFQFIRPSNLKKFELPIFITKIPSIKKKIELGQKIYENETLKRNSTIITSTPKSTIESGRKLSIAKRESAEVQEEPEPNLDEDPMNPEDQPIPVNDSNESEETNNNTDPNPQQKKGKYAEVQNKDSNDSDNDSEKRRKKSTSQKKPSLENIENKNQKINYNPDVKKDSTTLKDSESIDQSILSKSDNTQKTHKSFFSQMADGLKSGFKKVKKIFSSNNLDDDGSDDGGEEDDDANDE